MTKRDFPQTIQEEKIALQAEIAQLRIDLLDAQKQILQLQTGTTIVNP
jgi:hypothetical protein